MKKILQLTLDLKKKLEESKKILLIGHKKPDGDCVGAILGFKRALEKKKKKVFIYLEDEPNSGLKNFFNEKEKVESREVFKKQFDITFVLDASSIDYIGGDYLKEHINNNYTVVIDHHKTNDGYGSMFIVNKHASSTCEIIFNLLYKMKYRMDRSVVEPLLLGICTDTGFFKYDNVTSYTFNILSKILSHDVKVVDIMEKFFVPKPLTVLNLLSEMIKRIKIVEINGENVVYTTANKELFTELGLIYEDVWRCGIFDNLKNLEKKLLFFIVMETAENRLHVEYRSDGFNVSQIANAFGGGGHNNASGCNLEMSINDSVDKILDYFKEQIS